MSKPLNEMSNKELWQLFPIILSEHNNSWKDDFASEKESIESTISPENIARISHIGSTAIPGLIAKPTIDILLEIEDNFDTKELITKLESIGYIYSPQPGKPAPHMMFMKGYTPEGFRGQAYHVHVRYRGDWDELYFRDYLLAHPEMVKEYGELKLRLKKQYEHDRDGYTDAKTDFIQRIITQAKQK